MRRVGIIAILQESNTFVHARTTLADFEADLLVTGAAVRTALADAHHEVGGFFAGLDRAGIAAVPILAARAVPSGPMTAATLDSLLALIDAGLGAVGPLDGLLVAPHGATVSETVPDVDGHWLAHVRSRVGAVPIIGTIDPHANLSAAMVRATDALVAYRTNPHVDQRDRGLEAARLMELALDGRIAPVQAACHPPLAIPIESQDPAAAPLRPHYDAASAMRRDSESVAEGPAGGGERRGAVLSTSIVLGFPYADVPEMGSAVIVVTDGDRTAAARQAEALAAGMWRHRDSFRPALLPVDEAVAHAATLPGPTCLLDMGDNVGGGSPADGTRLARAFLAQGLRGSFACLCDAEAAARAAAAGVGQRLDIAVGGRSPEWRNEPDAGPVAGSWRVAAVTDGRFTETRPRHGGATAFDQGLTAVLESDRGPIVMVTSRRMPPYSLGQLRHAGLDPGGFRILAAKGVHAPLAAYGEVCTTFLRVDTPGPTTADASRLRYAHRRRPLHPFEPDAVWAGDDERS